MSKHTTEVINADKRGNTVKAVCSDCTWAGRPRANLMRAYKDGTHHEESTK